MKELEQFCLKNGQKSVARFIKTYPKRLAAVIAEKGGSTKY